MNKALCCSSRLTALQRLGGDSLRFSATPASLYSHNRSTLNSLDLGPYINSCGLAVTRFSAIENLKGAGRAG